MLITFKLLSHTKRDDGLIGRYHLEVTDTSSHRTVTISAEPKHLASARCMKTLLLNRCMFYRATRKEHDQMVLEMLDPRYAATLE
jgi:hypothetical protein